MKNLYYLVFLSMLAFMVGCSSDNDDPIIDDEPEEVSPVVFDINAVPYPKLSDYNFFKAPMSDQNPVFGVIPFEPASALFTDYAKKKRFIWMPKGVSANYVADGELFDFPTGTILIKNFYYDNVSPNNNRKIIETRVMIRLQNEWIFANYVWNDEQNEAFLDLEGSTIPIEWSQNGQTRNVNYRIPSRVECHTCHKANEISVPIGPKPQNLNFEYTYAEGSKNQLKKLEEFGYLNSGYPSNIRSAINYADASQSLDLRMRSYLDINCAHCHSERGHCSYLPLKLSFNDTADPVNMGVCVTPNINISGFVGEEVTHIVAPRNPNKSAMYHRINTERENLRMPMVGRSIIHDEAVTLTTQWINSLEGECN